ncbi:MAG: uracil-DNA glycosylase family protein [Siculibacillus sp.]|nr:uracil-DNA glycosylase family protein [Siculibacillus sp.]
MTAPASPDDAFAGLLADIARCRICRDTPRGAPLPHEPRPVLRPSSTARLLIAGQAPGTRVHASGLPFTDPSGDRLRTWMGVTKEVFYDASRIAIVPMGFCFPGHDAHGGDLPPRRECAPAWRARVMAEMPAVDLVLAVGRPAQLWHLGDDSHSGLGEAVAAWREILERAVVPKVLPLPHPSWRNNGWLKRHLWFEADVVPLLRRLVAERMAHAGEG